MIPGPPAVAAADPLSRLATDLRGSEILRIAAEIRALIASGQRVVNLTVGDFSPAEFRIPKLLEQGIVEAVQAGECVYPPSMGMDALRAAVRRFYQKWLGLEYPTESVVITAGARPSIYALFRALVNPGERVVFGVPSWNNSFYCAMVGAQPVALDCGADTDFLPTAAMLRKPLHDARLLSLNSPLNPTGTRFDAGTLAGICDVVLEENARRGDGGRPLYVMYDQVYWMLTQGDESHVHPMALRPEIAPWVIYVDAISKAFAATGLRVGWSAGPAPVIKVMSDINTHVGAWAPRPEQVATARLLGDDASLEAYARMMRHESGARMTALADGLRAMKAEGLPVDCTQPQGAIYVSARFDLAGRRAPDGTRLETNDDIRRYLLSAAGLAAIPFDAFDANAESGWFRLSVGVISVRGIEELLPRIRSAVVALS